MDQHLWGEEVRTSPHFLCHDDDFVGVLVVCSAEVTLHALSMPDGQKKSARSCCLASISAGTVLYYWYKKASQMGYHEGDAA